MRTRLLAIFLCSCLMPIWAQVNGDNHNWMARLNDATPITMLSIPGTHDTGTGNGFTPEWAEYSKELCVTQDCTLGQQWASGIRAFDLRPAVVKASNGKSTLHIFHGPMKTNLNYEDAIRQLIDSVTKSPSEFAFVVMRHEDDGDKGSKEWEPLMNAFLNSNGIKEHIINYSPSLTVKDMRGKILVMSRVHYADSPVGAYIENWTSEEDLLEQMGVKIWSPEGQGRMFVQDYYDTSSKEKMQTKLDNITRMLGLSMYYPGSKAKLGHTLPRPLIINHTSGYDMEKEVHGISAATSDGYRDNAAHTNKTALKYIKKHKGITGFVMMDFAGVNKSGEYNVRSLDLTKAVINQNFR